MAAHSLRDEPAALYRGQTGRPYTVRADSLRGDLYRNADTGLAPISGSLKQSFRPVPIFVNVYSYIISLKSPIVNDF